MSAKINVEKRNQYQRQYIIKWRKNNKENIKQYDYWRRRSPIGILARAYFD